MKKVFHIKKLDSGYILTENYKAKAMESAASVECVIVESLKDQLKTFISRDTFLIEIEVTINPPCTR